MKQSNKAAETVLFSLNKLLCNSKRCFYLSLIETTPFRNSIKIHLFDKTHILSM